MTRRRDSGANGKRPRAAKKEANKPRVRIETFSFDVRRDRLVRKVRTRNRGSISSSLRLTKKPKGDLSKAFDRAWLRTLSAPKNGGRRSIRVADFFSGCGMMTLGVAEACRAIGYRCDPVVAIDFNSTALDVYSENFPDATVLPVSVETYLGGKLGTKATAAERELVKRLGRIDVFVAGPPCQGHSDLNNHTRRHDSRNALFAKVARFAQLVKPKHIIVENVRGILHDRGHVFARTRNALVKLGYKVDAGLLNIGDFGVAQRRQRFVMIASRVRDPDLRTILARYGNEAPGFGWVCGDLKARNSKKVFDSAPRPSKKNKKRIDFLFKHDVYDLPDRMRPDCHKLKDHSYNSVYGRLWWDKPSQTITTGFGSMGQGRYVHPALPRTITPHEAARLQFVPDFFRFSVAERTALAEMIGNGVPPKLTYFLALELLR